MPYDLAVVIINFKTAEMTKECVRSVLPEIAGRNACVIVVDNFSSDGSLEVLRNWIDGAGTGEVVRLLNSDRNRGFSGGNNLGMRYVKAEHYMLLNSDAFLRPGSVRTLLDTFQQGDRIGIVSPRLEYENGTPQISCFRFHRPISEFIDIACTGVLTRLLGRYDVPLELQSGISWPEWTSFACVVISRELIEDIGYMDEGYFLYYEDSDYCRMALNNGWKVANNPAASVAHLRGGSADLKRKKKAKQRLPSYYFESRGYYFRKHHGRFGLLMANVCWSAGRLISLVREHVEGKTPVASERQWLDIWTEKSRGTRTQST